MELTINEIDFLVDIECKSFLQEQTNRFEVMDVSNNLETSGTKALEKSIDENCTMLFFNDRLSAVLSYKKLINAPETFMLWDMQEESYCIVILTEWLTRFRDEGKQKIPTYN